MGAGGSFGVVLNGEERVHLVGEAFEALIVQIDVSRDRAHLRQRGFVHCEAVVLAGDFDLPGGEVSYRVVDAIGSLPINDRTVSILSSTTDGSPGPLPTRVPSGDARTRQPAARARRSDETKAHFVQRPRDGQADRLRVGIDHYGSEAASRAACAPWRSKMPRSAA